jgi:hypothetical protein
VGVRDVAAGKSLFDIITEIQQKHPGADQRRLAGLLAEKLQEDDGALIEAAKYLLGEDRHHDIDS